VGVQVGNGALWGRRKEQDRSKGEQQSGMCMCVKGRLLLHQRLA
jgi:hypothetical protein